MRPKTTLTLLATGALILGSFSSIHAEEKGKAKGRPGDGSFLKAIDKNGDKSISKEEAGERWNRLGKLDKDGDGAVSMQELMAMRGGKGKGTPEGAPGRGAPGEMFKRADKNDDGKISKDEVPEQAWERLGKLDKDGDGAVSKEEMAAMMRQRGGKGPDGKGRPQGGPGEMFKRFDKNEDGKIAESEVPAEMWAKVRKADDNADGLVSQAELNKVMAQRDGKKPEGTKPDGEKKKKRPALEGDKEA